MCFFNYILQKQYAVKLLTCSFKFNLMKFFFPFVGNRIIKTSFLNFLVPLIEQHSFKFSVGCSVTEISEDFNKM